jgi:hypothetical protein
MWIFRRLLVAILAININMYRVLYILVHGASRLEGSILTAATVLLLSIFPYKYYKYSNDINIYIYIYILPVALCS